MATIFKSHPDDFNAIREADSLERAAGLIRKGEYEAAHKYVGGVALRLRNELKPGLRPRGAP